MTRRDKIRKTNEEDSQPVTALGLLNAMIEANAAQARSLDALRQRIEIEAEEAQKKEAEYADLLGETRLELAKMVAALEIERAAREAAECAATELEAVVTQIRAALGTMQAPGAPDPSIGVPATNSEIAPAIASTAAIDAVPVCSGAAEVNDPAVMTTTSDVDDGHAHDGLAAEQPTKSVPVLLDLSDHEVESLDRLARQRAISREAFVGDLIRLALGAAIAAEGDHLFSGETTASGPAAPG